MCIILCRFQSNGNEMDEMKEDKKEGVGWRHNKQ